MSVAIRIPYQLRVYCDGAADLFVDASTVGGALKQLRADHPEVYVNVCDETGRVRRHINLFVNLTLVRQPQGLEQSLAPGDTLFILTAVSGG